MKAVTSWVAVHRKLVVFAVGAVLTVCIQVWGTSNVWVSLGVLAATGAGVYGAPNVAARAAVPVPAEKTLMSPPGGHP